MLEGSNGPAELCKGCGALNPSNFDESNLEKLLGFYSGLCTRISTQLNARRAGRAGCCSVCRSEFPQGRFFFQRISVDAATGAEQVYRVCSRPCYMQLPQMYPELAGKLV